MVVIDTILGDVLDHKHPVSDITGTIPATVAWGDVTGTLSNQTDLKNALDAKQATSEKGIALGYASLDAAGKVPVTQLPSSIMEYQGTWNATTNTPSLADGTGSTGDVYRVSVAGTQNLGSGAITFDVGDYAIYNGSIWEKSDTTDAVSTVFGRTGTVTAQSNDYTWNQIDKTTSNIADITTKSHTSLTDIGTNTHAQIDTALTRLANTSGTNTGDQTVPANTTATTNQFFTAYNSSTGAFTKARPTWADIDKTTSSLADITTKTHSLLSSLTADDHTQYALLAGRSSGQTLTGGVAANEGITLKANSATSGNSATSTVFSVKTGDSGATTALSATNEGRVSIPVSLAVGATPAQSGELRVSNNQAIWARNAANSADVQMIKINASDRVELGTPLNMGNQGISGVYDIEQNDNTKWKIDNVGNATFAGLVSTNTLKVGGNSLTVSATATVSGTNSGDQIVPSNTTATTNQFFTAYNSSTGAFTKARPTWADIDKTTSSIVDITTKTHSLLGSLTADDHTQYALLAGRSGGQTLIGGTAASETLTLQSTSNATKGKILFGTSAYDEVNNRLGIGTTSPTVTIGLANGAARTILLEAEANGTAGRELTIQAGNTTAGTADIAGGTLTLNAGLGTGAGGSSIRFRTGAAQTAGLTTIQTMTTRMTITNGGDVGIGQTIPYSNLHVADSAGAIITIQRSDSSVTASDSIGKIQWFTNDTSTTTNPIAANIEVQATNSIGSDINPGRMIFRTTGTGVAESPTERMRITENGDVGIGVTVPRGMIHAHDGVCGHLVTVRTAVNATAQTFIPDGTGDVTQRVHFNWIINHSGGTSTAGQNTVVNGGNLDVPFGGDAWRFAVSAAGAFTIARLTGTGTADVTVNAIWQ